MASSHQPALLWKSQLPLWLASIANLGAALLQLLLFVPQLSEGRNPELALLPTSASVPLVFRVDSLGLIFGVAWTLALALITASIATWSPHQVNNTRLAWPICLLAVGLLLIAYSRDLLLLYIGWEVAGLGLWLALRPLWQGRKRWLILALHSPGWPLLLIAALGLAMPLTPPAGGSASPWPLPVAGAFAVVALVRSGCWPFHAWQRLAAQASGGAGALLIGSYCMAAPFLLARALVAAPWDATSIWALSLLGTLALLGNLLANLEVRGASRIPAIAPLHAAAAIIGFALSPASPLAATGAIALLLSGIVSLTAQAPGVQGLVPDGGLGDWNPKISPFPTTWVETALGGWSTLLGGSLGAWAITQAALGLHYGLIAAILLPAGAFFLFMSRDEGPRTRDGKLSFVLRLIPAAMLAFAGLFPQAALEWVLRPAVGAMAGGVGALRSISGDWGVGLMVHSDEETLLAALPATGIALAVAMASIPLYWLTRLVRHFVLPATSTHVPTNDSPGDS